MKAACAPERAKISGIVFSFSLNGKPISRSEAQKILVRAAAGMVVEKMCRLERLAAENQDTGGLQGE